MMFNSINSDINNYNSIPFKRQFVKQQFVRTNQSRLPSNLGYNSYIKQQNRQSPYSKPQRQKHVPFKEKDFYQQNYEVHSPFQQNLRHSNAKSYTSEQYYRGSQSDNQSQKSNQWGRNSASYFPTSQLFPSQNQMYASSNPFKKHTEKQLSYNFDMFSNKSKSRIKEMNEKIDQTTKFILKNGLIHQKQSFSSAIQRSLSKQRSREKIAFESPRNLQHHPSRNSSDRKSYSSMDRKKQFVAQNFAQPQIMKRSEDYQFSKPLFFETSINEQRPKAERMISYTPQIPTNIASPFQSNQRMTLQKDFNQNNETIDFQNFQETQNIKPEIRQKSYQLPSTYRKDITFNMVGKDQSLSFKELGEIGNQFSTFGSKNLQFDKPALYASQSQQTFYKSKRPNLEEQQLKTGQNTLPQFELKPYSRSKNNLGNVSKFQRSNEFQPTDLIVLDKNHSDKQFFEKVPSRSHLEFRDHDKNFKSSRLNYENNRQIKKQQSFKRASTLDQNAEFFEFQKNYDSKSNFKKQDQDFEFKDFEDESIGTYEKFVPSQEKFYDNFSDNQKKSHYKSETDRTQHIAETQSSTAKQIPTQSTNNSLKKYISQMKDKQSQVIAAALIILAIVILIIQLTS